MNDTKGKSLAGFCKLYIAYSRNSNLGWFLYSYEGQDTETLSEILSNLNGFQVGCRWREIQFGPRKLPKTI